MLGLTAEVGFIVLKLATPLTVHFNLCVYRPCPTSETAKPLVRVINWRLIQCYKIK